MEQNGQKKRQKDDGNKPQQNERLQQRREQRALRDEEELQEIREEEESNPLPLRPFLVVVGDRVWFRDNRSDADNSNTYRGIVQNVHEELFDIIPLQAKFDGLDVSWLIALERVYPNWCNMTTRFDVGDHVLCQVARGCWVPSKVDYL